MCVVIEEFTEQSDFLTDGIRNLISELSANALPPTDIYLSTMASNTSTKLFLAVENRNVLGMITIVVVAIPTGIKAYIEDMVVAERYRKRGVASMLVLHALRYAKENNALKVDLTSNSSRADAHRLYDRSGFEQRSTTNYRVYIENNK